MDQDRDANAPETDGPEPNPFSLKELPRWKKLLLMGAGLFLLIGVALMPFEGGSDLSKAQTVSQQSPNGAESTGGQGAGAPAGGNALVPGGGSSLVPGTTPTPQGQPTPAPAPAEGQHKDLSPAFMKMGFSFFVGFAIGLAFRSLLRLAMIFVGLQLAVLFGLESIDWIAIDVDAMKRSFDALTTNLQSQFESFQSFLTGRLPQAGLASLGLFTGFKKS